MFLGGMEKKLWGICSSLHFHNADYMFNCSNYTTTHTSRDGTYTGSGNDEQTLGAEIGVKEMIYLNLGVG
jgi:hypothetical protein